MRAWLTLFLLTTAAAPAATKGTCYRICPHSGGSMAPAVPDGCRVVLEAVLFREIRTGDVIAYRARDGRILLHRVFKLMPGANGGWWPKGDANPLPDPEYITAANLVGRLHRIIPPG